jgi:hypothetical protein
MTGHKKGNKMSEDKKRERATNRHAVTFTGTGKTDQGTGQNHQIANIIAEYRANGTRPRVSTSQPLYGDFRNSKDLHDQMVSYQAAQARFDDLPSNVRKAANNDLIEFVSMLEQTDDSGRLALTQAGLKLDGWSPPEPSPLTSPEAGQAEPTGAPDASVEGDS